MGSPGSVRDNPTTVGIGTVSGRCAEARGTVPRSKGLVKQGAATNGEGRFKAWSEPDRAMRWWGPQGFTTAHCEMDVRPGGAYRVCMRSPEGTEHWQRGVCREAVEPERLVFSFAWVDAEGRPGRETVVTVSLAEYGAKTKLTLHQAEFETVAARDLHQGGWASALYCLADRLAQG